MNIQQHPGFFVAGLTARTNNAHEMSGKGKIGNVWQEFPATEFGRQNTEQDRRRSRRRLHRLRDRPHRPLHLSSRPARPLGRIAMPANLTFKHIPAGRYAVFSSNRGPKAQVVPELWQRIWSMSPKELGGTRAFKTDYEIYDQRAADPRTPRSTSTSVCVNRFPTN